jgi:DNA repair protein RadA/Sms
MIVDEPAADLSVVAAVASSVRNRAVGSATAVFGEVGLGGEVRGISQPALRIREVAQMGLRRCVLPRANIDDTSRGLAEACELVGVGTISEALDTLIA